MTKAINPNTIRFIQNLTYMLGQLTNQINFEELTRIKQLIENIEEQNFNDQSIKDSHELLASITKGKTVIYLNLNIGSDCYFTDFVTSYEYHERELRLFLELAKSILTPMESFLEIKMKL